MFNCLTKEEILVCLKYWLDTALVMFSMVSWSRGGRAIVREDFGEFGGGRHDETVVRVGPRDQMLDCVIFEHTFGWSVTGHLHIRGRGGERCKDLDQGGTDL